MGNIMIWIARGLYVGGGALIGVLFEKLSAWVAGMLPPTVNVRDKSGTGYAPWFVVALTTLAGIVVFVVVKMIKGKKKLFMLAGLVFLADHLLFAGVHSAYTTAGLLFSIAGAATEAEPVTYLPEYIAFTIGTVPTNIKIEVLGDGVTFSLDGSGLTNLNGIRLVGELPANTYVYHLADGFIRKNATFTIVNADAAQLDVYGWSDSPGMNYIIHESAKAFANQDNNVPPFLYSAFPSAAATDVFSVTWTDKRTRKQTGNNLTRLELVAYLAQHQEVVSTRYNIDNMATRITGLQFRPSADQNFYFTHPRQAR